MTYFITRRMYRINKTNVLSMPAKICKRLGFHPGDIFSFIVISDNEVRIIKLKQPKEPL